MTLGVQCEGRYEVSSNENLSVLQRPLVMPLAYVNDITYDESEKFKWKCFWGTGCK